MTSLLFCQKAKELLDSFGDTVRALVELHEEQFQSIVGGDLDSTRFDDRFIWRMSESIKLNTLTCNIWRLTAARRTMDLTKSDRAKITDTVHSIQSARASLADIDETKVPKVEAIHDCLESADKRLRVALRQGPATKKSLT